LYELAGGEDNVVQLVLHMDETTPHIQAIFVPLSDEAPSTSKKKKAPGTLTLNAKPWTSPGKWQRMWTTYAAAMAKHGLRRGEFRPENEHQNLKAGRDEVIEIAKKALETASKAEAKAEQTNEHVHMTLAKQSVAIERQDKKIELVVKKQEQVIHEQRTLIESLTAQLKQAHETIKRLLGRSGTQTPTQTAQAPVEPQNKTYDELGL
jgi:hypothetical protein